MDGSLASPRSPRSSIIVPARNEEASLGDCLGVADRPNRRGFRDHRSRRRFHRPHARNRSEFRRSAGNFAGASATTVWTGKNNALIAGAKEARAPWLLFTDADTVHLPGSLARALAEAKTEGRPICCRTRPSRWSVTFAERAVMPVVFAELAAQYPPQKVREQNSGIVAANGQYILVRRAAYDAVGGHAAVATEILEDVALARLFRNAGKRVYFRYGGDAVRTRMYRNWPQLREGWTKNLALLFPRPERLGRPEFVLVVSGMVGAWRSRVRRSQPALRVDCCSPLFWLLPVPANPRRAFLACEQPDRNRFRSADVRLPAAALEEGPREWPSTVGRAVPTEPALQVDSTARESASRQNRFRELRIKN